MSTSKEKRSTLPKRKRVDMRRVMTHPWTLISFALGAGLSPVAPGTIGTLAAIPLYLLLSEGGPLIYAILVLVLFFVGVVASAQSERILGVQDHSGIVIDEVLGFLIAMSFTEPTLNHLIAGFLLFRFFDIVKPWPIRWLDQHVKGGLGIMLDDIVAGGCAAVGLELAEHIIIRL